MSQIEHCFRQFLSKNPEVEFCYQEGLINRRSLARYLIKQNVGKNNQLEAIIAMLRRFDFRKISPVETHLLRLAKLTLKDNIVIVGFEKDKELLQNLQKIVAQTNYDKGETLKIILGSSSITLFLDKESEHKLHQLPKKFVVLNKFYPISEISILFPDSRISTARGVLSAVSRELAVHNIPVNELITASRELLIYIEEKYTLKAYEIIKDLQR